jgi:DNA (cytosine-5)-methyltransferase 1
MTRTFYEFFCGGGMARAGLGSGWSCHFANDFDYKKGAAYEANWGNATLKVADVRSITPADLPGIVDLTWASFPCQDLSLAGGGAGLKGERSGTFWPFWQLMTKLIAERRAPRMVALENVCGTLNSHDGRDFAAIGSALANAGYNFGALVVDAALFVPQSRPRLFIIAAREDLTIPEALTSPAFNSSWHPAALRRAYERLPPDAKKKWLWWNISTPMPRTADFCDLIEQNPTSVEWHTAEETRRLLDMMSDLNLEKVREAKRSGKRIVGAVYKRTRRDEYGRKVQRAEVRFDNVAGCLRTPAGGSSRQVIVVVEGPKVRSRLISSRETARLMGLPDSYILPPNYNEAYHLTGDGVAVPVVRHIAHEIFEPLLACQSLPRQAAA